uniref:Regulatory protein zeste n=1 Tax=Heliothis virescens TaxID=7102 RepID=A0A2A4JPK5_HELVI
MTDRVIASRPSLEQVSAIVDFMEKHPALALGQLRGLEGRDESKKLWFKLTRIVNNITGPTRPMKSWIKYWADKKSTVRSKVLSGGGDPNNLCSNIEKKIWDLFLANDSGKTRGAVKQESNFIEESLYNEDSMDQNHVESDPVLAFEEPVVDFEERQMGIMEKLLKVMSDQAAAMTQLAHASHANAQAMERLADASQIQARAIDRLATTFETISAATHDVRNAIVDIDATMKRFYSTSPT